MAIHFSVGDREARTRLPTIIGAKLATDPNDRGTYPGSTPVGVALAGADWRRARSARNLVVEVIPWRRLATPTH